MRCLIVEDNPQMRHLIKLFLSDLADEIIEREDGDEALTAYRECHPDWVLMDIRMERMDGLSALRQLLVAFPDARIVMLTQYDDSALRQVAHEGGAVAYIEKENLFLLREILAQGEA